MCAHAIFPISSGSSCVTSVAGSCAGHVPLLVAEQPLDNLEIFRADVLDASPPLAVAAVDLRPLAQRDRATPILLVPSPASRSP